MVPAIHARHKLAIEARANWSSGRSRGYLVSRRYERHWALHASGCSKGSAEIPFHSADPYNRELRSTSRSEFGSASTLTNTRSVYKKNRHT